MTPIKDDNDLEEMIEDLNMEADEEEAIVSEVVDIVYDEGEELIMSDEIETEDEPLPSVLFMGISKPKSDEEWFALLQNAQPEGVPLYSISESYSEGNLIKHPLFGFGVVAKVRTPKKMEVIFKDSEGNMVKKLMAMNISRD
ncbi:MAG: hypothetical protein N2260_00950 [Syntrophobacterales bacterium]|nr:hypothetical protein [Syntrophobacterales bacterium]